MIPSVVTKIALAAWLCAGGALRAERFSQTLEHRFPARDRPELSGTEILLPSASGAFLVHYTTFGADATNAGYAVAIAAWADTAQMVLIDTLSWPALPSDGTGGGDSRYDIYLRGLGASTSGYTQLEGPIPGGYPDDATSFVVIATGMTSAEASAAVAHYVNQACQYAYSSTELGAWMEQTAGWIEELVFPTADQWAMRTGAYLGNCHKYLFVSDGWTEHGALLWPKYLCDSSTDPDLVRRIWARCATVANNNTISATQQELAVSGLGSLEREFQEFSSWNYLCGSRDDGLHYAEGDLITGSVPMIASHVSYPVSGGSVSLAAPYGLGSNYVEFVGNGAGGALHVDLSGSSAQSPWGGGIVAVGSTGDAAEGVFEVGDVTAEGDTTITGWSTLQQVILVVQNLRLVAGSQGQFQYGAQVVSSTPPSAPTGLSTLVVGDWIRLTWSPSTDPDGDLTGYWIHRAAKAFLPLQAMTVIGAGVSDEDPGAPGVQWTDANTLGADVVGDGATNYFWAVTARDAAANESTPSNTAGEFDYIIPYPP